MSDLENAIEKAASLLKSGGLVAFPTETVYGLGASIFFPKSIARIFEVKERPFFDPLIVHLAERSQVGQVATVPDEWKNIFDRLADAFWPGPLTMLLPKKSEVPDIVTSGLPKVGVRVPSHPVTHRLLSITGDPVCAPSANKFGRLSPTLAQHVEMQLGQEIDFILDGGPCTIGVESTVVNLEKGRVQVLRPGGVTVEEMESVLAGKVEVVFNVGQQILAPGQVESHYAPRTPLKILSSGVPLSSETNKGLLAWTTPKEGYRSVEIMSPKGDMKEAAVRLFACLHRLDQLGLSLIEVEPVEESGLGLAIMNRLRKAQAAF